MSGKLRILVVDDDKRMANTLVDIFKHKGFEADVSYSGAEALEKVKQNNYDCVLSDIKMPEINGVELIEAVKKIRPEIPIVLMTAYASDVLVEEGLKKGAIATLSKPLDVNLVLTFFSSLRKERSIVIVDDDPCFCTTLGDILEDRGFSITEVTDPANLPRKLKPDEQVVLLDVRLGDTNGLEVLKKIRAKYHNLPVVMITGYREEMAQTIKAALKIGAYTCLYKPFGLNDLFQVLTEIREQEMKKTLGQPIIKENDKTE